MKSKGYWTPLSFPLCDEPPLFAKIGTQKNFISNRNEELNVKHIFKMDDLSKLTDYLYQITGEHIALGVENKPDVIPFEISDKIRSKLEDHFSEDFELYHSVK